MAVHAPPAAQVSPQAKREHSPLDRHAEYTPGRPEGERPIQTMALRAGSPAIDARDNAGVPATDQCGFRRMRDGDGLAGVDIGAFER
jgi:hypothetical protein